MTVAWHDPLPDDAQEDEPQLFVAYNRAQSVVVTYDEKGFAGLQLSDAAMRLTEESLARSILAVADAANQKARAARRDKFEAGGISTALLDKRGLPSQQQAEQAQQRILDDPDL